MSDITTEAVETTADIMNGQPDDMYYEDEFGLGLKAFLIVRVLFYAVGIFMIIGAFVCIGLGLTNMDDLVSNATGLSASNVDYNFDGYKTCMFVQAVYTILSFAAAGMLLVKRSKLFAFVDIALFVVLMVTMFATGSANLLTNNSAWIFYALLNPIFSFVALFVGKHFKYMPLIK